MMRNPILLLLALLTATALHAQEEDANLNVIVNGTAAQIDLSADYPFAAPEEFTATHVTIHRNVAAGTGTFCLPFEVSAEEIDADAEMGTYYEVDGENQKVLFEKTTGVGANTPFLMRGLSAATARVVRGACGGARAVPSAGTQPQRPFPCPHGQILSTLARSP